MITDSQLAFVPIGGNLSLVAAAGVAIPSLNVIDLLGQGVGTAPSNIIGNASTFGADVGIGAITPFIEAVIGTACATGNAATLNVAFQAAPDSGAGGGYQPGTWTTIEETGPIAVARLTAGQIVARFVFSPAFPASLAPRFLRLLFQVASSTNFTAGTISSAIVTMSRDDNAQKFATKNFIVA